MLEGSPLAWLPQLGPAVTGIADLEQLGQAEVLRKRLYHILTEGNKDPNAFRATSRYVVAILKRHGGRTQEG